MKYIVEVNAKWLVSIEADSLLDAEHKLLDYNGVWGAMAYDSKAMKTDTFAGAVQTCGMVSMNELHNIVDEAMETKLNAVKAIEAMKDAEQKCKELEAALQEAKDALRDAQMAKSNAVLASQRAEEKLGVQRN